MRPGAITEIVGRLSSGRTSLLLTCLIHVVRAGGVAALVDVDDAFDPVGAAAGGLDLRQLLWVRCGGRRAVGLRAVDLVLRYPGFAVVAFDLGERPVRLPLTVAYRWRLAVRRSLTSLLVLARRRVVGAGAALAVTTVQGTLQWSGPGARATRLACLRTDVQVLRAQHAHGIAPESRPWSAWWSA